ncbi:ArsR/SmtB family transcription factor [Halohasta salina]|uniref:ArsR/SmtB family transcription factor n=1 Tax=Halohasta salina TaxID=2961621 RepID=UPI0020A4B022|nr:helix-turn-helix domain-containing protein [Halohasta salina]
MKSLLPLKSRVEPTDDGATVVSIADDAADEVFETLSSSTARQILAALYEEPRPASELAAETDTTVQNVRYHLENLQDAELIAAADTWYSEKGTEMTVYAPCEAALVVTAGTESTTDRLKATIKDLLGALGVFGLLSLLVQYVATTYLQSAPTDDSAAGPEPMSVETTDAATAADRAAGGGLVEFLTEPGVVFFLGCVIALVVVVVLIRRRQ